MMKLRSCNAKGLIKLYKNGDTINIVRATSFSTINHNNPKDIHSNKIDAPFATTATTTEPKVTRRQLSVENPNYEPHHDHNHNHDHINKQDHTSTTEEAADYVADKARRGTKGVVETAFNVGMNVAEGMEQTFGAIKNTTKNVKDTVLGEYDNEPGKNRSHGNVDKHVEDLRRKARGYDQREIIDLINLVYVLISLAYFLLHFFLAYFLL